MPEVNSKLPRAVVVGLGLAIILDTFIQVTWKVAASGAAAEAPLADALQTIMASPWFAAAMIAFTLQLVNWVRVLSRADLSFAQPITALSYITVLGVSAICLREPITLTRVAGVGLILIGVWLISRTPFQTANPPNAEPDRPPS